MKMKLFKSTIPWLVLAVLLPVLALLFTAGPVGAGCCGDTTPPVTAIVRVFIGPDDGGDVEVEGRLPGAYPFVRIIEEGTSFHLEAIAADGYYFVGWSGGLSGNTNPVEFKVLGDVNVTAQFFPEEIVSEDNRLQLLFPVGTIVYDEGGDTLCDIAVTVDAAPPSLPSEADIVGETYELGPHGATFDHPVTLNLSFDPTEIPEGVAEGDLSLGYYDEGHEQWQVLPSAVNIASHTVSARLNHLSTFAVIAPLPPAPPAPPPPADAAFSTSALSISPLEADIGETVTVSVLVTNTGELEGSCSLNLVVNGAIVETREITMASGSQTVTFSTTADEAGSYSVEVNGLAGSFTVVGALASPSSSSSSSGFPSAIVWVLVGLATLALVLGGVVGPIVMMRRRHEDDDYYY